MRRQRVAFMPTNDSFMCPIPALNGYFITYIRFFEDFIIMYVFCIIMYLLLSVSIVSVSSVIQLNSVKNVYAQRFSFVMRLILIHSFIQMLLVFDIGESKRTHLAYWKWCSWKNDCCRCRRLHQLISELNTRKCYPRFSNRLSHSNNFFFQSTSHKDCSKPFNPVERGPFKEIECFLFVSRCVYCYYNQQRAGRGNVPSLDIRMSWRVAAVDRYISYIFYVSRMEDFGPITMGTVVGHMRIAYNLHVIR